MVSNELIIEQLNWESWFMNLHEHSCTKDVLKYCKHVKDVFGIY